LIAKFSNLPHPKNGKTQLNTKHIGRGDIATRASVSDAGDIPVCVVVLAEMYFHDNFKSHIN
jgi:hypothetical protein